MSNTMINTYNTNTNTNTDNTDYTHFDLLLFEYRRDPRMRNYIDWVLKTHKPVSPDPNNPILITDSYKQTHGNMCNDTEFVDGIKETLTGMYASVEPRKGARDSHVVVAGVHELANKITSIRVTIKDLHDAIVFLAPHFSTPQHDGRYHFNPWPWLKVIYIHNGQLPLKICGLPEGTILPVGIPIVTIESTDPDCAQLVTHFEPLILQTIWYPTTCATNALGYSKVIKSALKTTATEDVVNGFLPFSLQCFALRGVTCMEAARIGCGAILYITMGSDTIPAVSHIMGTIGNNHMVAYSVAAIEHNTAMMQGRAGEFKQLRRVLKAYPTGILSYVADTYDMLNFINQVTTGELKDLIMARDGTFVIRPDSSLLNEDGTEMSSAETIAEILDIMETNLSDLITKNSKGFKCFPSQYKIIYGDGLNIPKIASVLDRMIQKGWCASNIVFGVGGNFAQRIDRDTERFAMKSSEQTFLIEDESGNTTVEVRDVCKETPGKESKRGRFHIALDNGVPKCFRLGDPAVAELPNLLETFCVNGQKLLPTENIDMIRDRINAWRDVYNF
jgi:nicotinamide phosphoribosyltransferase